MTLLAWRCDARRSHGVCGAVNGTDESTCGACGADCPREALGVRGALALGAAPPQAAAAPAAPLGASVTDTASPQSTPSEDMHT